MNDMHKLEVLLSRIQYKDWSFRVGSDRGTDAEGRWWLQVEFGEWRGRKWFLSKHMTDSEVVATAFKACLTAEEHECREAFRYRGMTVFGPHIDVDRMADLLRHFGDEMLDAREPPPCE